eukprot:Awhi_evm2s10209
MSLAISTTNLFGNLNLTSLGIDFHFPVQQTLFPNNPLSSVLTVQGDVFSQSSDTRTYIGCEELDEHNVLDAQFEIFGDLRGEFDDNINIEIGTSKQSGDFHDGSVVDMNVTVVVHNNLSGFKRMTVGQFFHSSYLIDTTIDVYVLIFLQGNT